jgi:hypothetical protein
MDLIKNIFDNYFSNWNIKLSKETMEKRLNGFIKDSGWLIQYCFGIENDIEYLDFYATHRMTGDDHIRIYENGNTKNLPVFKIGYLVDCPDPEPIRSKKLKEEGKEAFEKYNKEIAEMLIKKGFNKFTINMSLNSGIVK